MGRRCWTASVGVLLWWLAALSSAPAQDRYALLIGNGHYQKPWRTLTNPPNDIKLIADALTKIGFKRDNIELVYDADLDALHKARVEFQTKLRKAGPNTIGFFYYAGHGAARKAGSSEAANYIIPKGVENSKSSAELFERSMKLTDFVYFLRKASSADLIIVFDACSNEIDLRGNDARAFVREPDDQLNNVLLGFATLQGSFASDAGEGGGPYAKELAAQLPRPGQHHEEIFYNTALAVEDATKRKQFPWYQNRFRKRLYLFQVVSPPDPQELAFWQETLAANTPEAYKRYVDRYPTSPHSLEALRLKRAREAELAWIAALTNKSASDIEAFIEDYFDSDLVEEARAELSAIRDAEERRALRQVRASPTVEKYREFLRQYPNTKQRFAIEDEIATLQQAVSSPATTTPPSQTQDPVQPPTLTSTHIDPLSVEPRPEKPERMASLTRGITEATLLAEQKRRELKNLFFPQATFSRFPGGKIGDRLDFRRLQPLRRLLLTNDLTRLYSAGDDGAVRVWDLDDDRESKVLSSRHAKKVYALVRSQNSRYMATGSLDRKVMLWDSQSGTPFEPVTVRPEIYSMTFSPTGRWIAAAGSNGQVDFIRVRDRKIVNRRNIAPAQRVHAIAYLPNRSEDLILGDGAGNLRLWSVVRGKERFLPKVHGQEIFALAVSPDGQRVASAGKDNAIKFWTNTLESISTINQAHRTKDAARSKYITSLRFTPDGRYVASGGSDFLIRIWDVKTFTPVGNPFVGHVGDVEHIEFTPDGKYMFTSSEDKTAKIWDVDERKLLYTMVAFPDGGYIIFDQDQRYLASDSVRTILTGGR